MKLQTTVALSESQKAQIVARGEELQTEYNFEMSQKYAAVFADLAGYKAYRVSNELIIIDNLPALEISPYNYGKYVSAHSVEYDFSQGIAQGWLRDGESVNHLMRGLQDLLNARDEAHIQKQKRDAEAAKQAEIERPAREAEETRIAEEKRIAKEAKDAEEAEQEATRQAGIETAKAEKKAWIEAHGSERLRKGFAAGHNCQKIYVSERGNAELGSGYELDYDAEIERKDRSCPTLEALNEAERLTEAGIPAKVVWLPDGTATEEDWQESCEAVEAILLGNYFYRTY